MFNDRVARRRFAGYRIAESQSRVSQPSWCRMIRLRPFVLPGLVLAGALLTGVSSPTFVLEGTSSPTNDDSLRAMAAKSSNPNLHFYPVRGASHFSLLAPPNQFLADRIIKDDGPKCILAFTEDEVNRAIGS